MARTPSLRETTSLPLPDSLGAVENLLARYDLPLGAYGRPGAKSTESIWAKVQKGETRFGEFEGRLVRILPAVARALITHTDEDGLRYVLVENDQGMYKQESMSVLERHIFADYALESLIQRKSRWAVWETMREGEDKDQAIVRGICEELVPMDPAQPGAIDPAHLKKFKRYGINDLLQLKGAIAGLLLHLESEETFEPPLEYPGLGTLYTAHTYHFPMPPFLYCAGYATRDEEGKINLFGWMPADVSADVIEAAARQQFDKEKNSPTTEPPRGTEI